MTRACCPKLFLREVKNYCKVDFSYVTKLSVKSSGFPTDVLLISEREVCTSGMLVCNVSELLLCCVLGTLLNYGEFLDFLVNLAVVLLILWRLGFSVVLEVHDQSL